MEHSQKQCEGERTASRETFGSRHWLNPPDRVATACGLADDHGTVTLQCPSLIAALAPGLCQPVDIYCERTSPAMDAELVNALSNVSFLVAAAAAWMLLRRQGSGAAGLVRALIGVTALIGLGSLLFHTLATRWAVWADVVPILAFMLLYLWLVLTRFFGWSAWIALPLLAGFFLLTIFAEAIIPPAVLRGGAMYVPALLAMTASGLGLLARRPPAGRALLLASLVFALSFAARSLDMPLCAAWPLGTHFVWHLLNGLLLYLLMRIAIGQLADPDRRNRLSRSRGSV